VPGARLIFCASRRPSVSTGPPGASGKIKVSGRFGKSAGTPDCADAKRGEASAAVITANAVRRVIDDACGMGLLSLGY
jgi:hypothetical protein